jgi:hypothetical protein
VRIIPVNSAALAPAAPQEVAALTNQSLPQTEIALHWRQQTVPPLVVGQELDALVLQILPEGNLLLDLQGIALEAESPGGLSAGQQLRVRVEQLVPQVVLHITDLEPTIEFEAARLLRNHLPAHADHGEVLQDLLTRLDTDLPEHPALPVFAGLKKAIEMLLSPGSPPHVEQLEKLTRDGGIYYEAKLSAAAKSNPNEMPEIGATDLKGLLLKALQEAEEMPRGVELRNAIHAELNHVETQQAVNLLAQLDTGGFQFQVPFFNGSWFSTASLSIEPDGKGTAETRDGRPKGFNLLFLLDLENFGRTRIDARVSDHELRAVFYIDRESSIALVREATPGLRETLLGMGYRDVFLAAKPLKEIPEEKRQKFDAIAIGGPTSVHLLDYKA